MDSDLEIHVFGISSSFICPRFPVITIIHIFVIGSEITFEENDHIVSADFDTSKTTLNYVKCFVRNISF